MKLVFSILLVLVTAVYILPVRNIIAADNITCIMENDGEKKDTDKGEKKKENNKDFYSSRGGSIPGSRLSIPKSHYSLLNLRQLLHQVETPPPDLL